MNKKGKYFKSNRLLFLSLVLINLTIILISLWYYRVERDAFIAQKIDQLNSIADIKIDQVVDWRNERYSDARYLSVSPQIIESFHSLKHNSANPELNLRLYNSLNGMFQNGKYESMIALDGSGRLFFSLPSEAFQSIATANTGSFVPDGSWSIQMSDYVISGKVARMQIIVPQVRLQGKDSLCSGWIIMNINLEKTLIPLLKAIPIPSETMEVILLQKEKNKFVSLDPKTKPTKLSAVLKNSSVSSGESNYPENFDGAAFGTDFKGESVIMVSHPIPGSNCILQVKMDKSEAFTDIRKLRFNLFSMAGMMILAFTSSISFFWMKQRSEFAVLETEKKMILERFDMLSKFANDAIIVYTKDLIILQVNDKVSELYGYTRDEILGMSAELLRSPEFRPDIYQTLDATIKQGGIRFETVHLKKDGTLFPAEVSLRYMELMGNHCFQAVVRDITQRKQFEKALMASEERLRLITNTMPLVVWTAKPDGTFDFVNSRFEFLTGINPFKEGLNSDFLHPDDRDKVISYWQNAMTEIREHQLRFRLRIKDGTYRWFLCLALPMCSESGDVIRWCGSATDVDELENIVQERTAEILSLNSKLQEHSYNLEYANKELEAFTFSVSHDLRAPLRAINGFSEILLEEYGQKLEAEGKEMLEKVLANASRMRQLIEDLLRLSRAGRQELRYTRIDMKALFNSMIEETKQLYPDVAINVVVHDMPEAQADLALLKQVIGNLLSNAVKFSSRQPISKVETGAIDEKEGIAYFVKDNGTGFNMNFAADLFVVFRRLSNAGDYEGTGVGLALVKRIIDKHGGKVWAESEPGKGATFYFSLPEIKTT